MEINTSEKQPATGTRKAVTFKAEKRKGMKNRSQNKINSDTTLKLLCLS